VLYQALDGGSPDGTVTNCLHALSFLARRPGRRHDEVGVLPANWGASGTYWVALTLRPWFLDPCCTHDWLLAPLGLDAGGLLRNGLDRNPSSNPVTAALQAALHPQLLPNRVRCGR
jgi:hypothetical protein